MENSRDAFQCRRLEQEKEVALGLHRAASAGQLARCANCRAPLRRLLRSPRPRRCPLHRLAGQVCGRTAANGASGQANEPVAQRPSQRSFEASEA